MRLVFESPAEEVLDAVIYGLSQIGIAVCRDPNKKLGGMLFLPGGSDELFAMAKLWLDGFINGMTVGRCDEDVRPESIERPRFETEVLRVECPWCSTSQLVARELSTPIRIDYRAVCGECSAHLEFRAARYDRQESTSKKETSDVSVP